MEECTVLIGVQILNGVRNWFCRTRRMLQMYTAIESNAPNLHAPSETVPSAEPAVMTALSAIEKQVKSAGADMPQDMLLELRNIVLVIQERAESLRRRMDQA